MFCSPATDPNLEALARARVRRLENRRGLHGAGCLHFGGLTLTEPTEHRDADEAWEFTLDDENDPERVAQGRSFAHLVRWPSRGDP